MNLVIIDLETTGIDSKKDKIIEIGAVRIENHGKRSEFHTLIDPHCSLSHVITDLTGITDEMLAGQPTMDDVASDLFAFMDNAIPIAHNASFEAGFLRKYIGKEFEDWLDTITLAKVAFPTLPSYALGNIVQTLELLNEEPHRALADARATELLYNTICKKFEEMDKGIIAALIEILEPKFPIYGDFLRNYEPNIFAPRYLPPYTKTEAQTELPQPDEYYTIDLKEVENYLDGKDGLKRHFEQYESREAQIEMALKVSGCFNDGSFLLAEAGTGTGKTIAYLLPAALMSYQGGSGVVISTHTINLQDQIMNKDIPDINKLFNNNLRSVLVKGRNHYLCYRKWENAYNDNEMENPAFMAMLLPWVVETEDGDGDVLNLNSYEKREWQNFSANSENCARSHCPYFRNKCFVHRVRKRAEQANLIIINHSLLLTDSMMENGILPHCDYLIIDEAHHLDKVAEDNLGFSFSFFDHILIMGDSKKLLLRLLRMAASPGIFTKEDELAEMKERQDILDNLLAKFDDNSIKGDMMFNGLKTGFSFFHEAKNPLSRTWRLDKKTRFDHKWQETETLISNYHIWVNELLVNFKKIKNMFYDDLSDESNEKDNYQLSALIIKLTACRDALYYFIHSESEDMVAWLEQGNERVMYPIMRLAPIKVNELLAENLFEDKKTIVFVSATLSVNDKFQYFKTNCGLNLINKHCEELLLTSPFDYEHMCLLVAAKDVPNVGEVSEYEYLDSISEAIIKMTLASKGRALVLFTSHVHLREVFRRIEKPLADQGIEVLGHDISGNRNSLLTKIRAKKNTVILGANSFWEGIDISGENLSLLIIVKLPFWPPDMPIMAAKMEKMKEEGKNDFSELSLPQAIIRFKQGFGRLLRNEGDRGIVCVLDRRIYEKRYGAQFINSLPIKKLRCGTIQEITNTIIKKL